MNKIYNKLTSENEGANKKFLTAMQQHLLSYGKTSGKVNVSSSRMMQDAGVEPTDIFDIPSMEGVLTDGEQLQQYNAAVQSIINANFSSGVRNGESRNQSVRDLLDYQQDAINEVARNFQTLNDPEASAQDKAKARASISQLSTSNLGDVKDPKSPFNGYRNAGGEAYFNEDARVGQMDANDLAGMLDDPEQLAADDYMVGDKVDQRGKAYRDAVKNIDYEPTPQRQTAQVADIDPRTVSDQELIDPTIADQIISQWDNPDFIDNIDMTGENALKGSLDYFDDIIANDGRDAVSEAFLNRAQREAEQRQRAQLDAAFANLDARGMQGSGGELQAYLQGAGQTMQAQFDAAMEAAAMQQQRKDAAAEQKAVQGRALQLLQDGRAQTQADAIDMATRERAGMKWQTEQQNAGKVTSAADTNFDWQGQRASQNASLQDTSYGDQFGADSRENFARGRNLEGVEKDVFNTGVQGQVQDAATRYSVDTGNRAVTEAGKQAAVGQVNTGVDQRLAQDTFDADHPTGQDPWQIVWAGSEAGKDIVKGIASYGMSEAAKDDKESKKS